MCNDYPNCARQPCKYRHPGKDGGAANPRSGQTQARGGGGGGGGGSLNPPVSGTRDRGDRGDPARSQADRLAAQERREREFHNKKLADAGVNPNASHEPSALAYQQIEMWKASANVEKARRIKAEEELAKANDALARKTVSEHHARDGSSSLPSDIFLFAGGVGQLRV
jgi:hypothetical protein